jgi:hypothetical protein
VMVYFVVPSVLVLNSTHTDSVLLRRQFVHSPFCQFSCFHII